MKLAIDAGHSFVTAGKRTPKFPDGTFMHEFEFNQATAFYLNEYFNKTKIETFYTFDPTGKVDYRYGASATDYTSRVGIANKGQADLFISIHANAIGDGVNFNNSYGVLFLADETRADHVEFAQTVMDQLSAVYPRKKTLAWIHGNTGQSLCKYSQMPTAVMECGFMTNIEDARLLLDDDYRRVCAHAIYLGIVNYALNKNMITQNDLKEMHEMNQQTREAAEAALHNLYLKGFVNNPGDWTQKLEESIPVWAFFIILERIVNDYGTKIDDFDKMLGGRT